MEDMMVVICDVAKRREVGVESDYKGDSGFGGIVDGFCSRAEGLGTERALLMASCTFLALWPQKLGVSWGSVYDGGIRVSRTNATESESLAVSNTILAVAGMATSRVKVLVSVCRLGVKISDQSVMLLADGHIQEVNLLVRNFWGEFDSSVEGVDVVNKTMKTFSITSPNEENIIDEAPPYPRTTGSRVQHLVVQV